MQAEIDIPPKGRQGHVRPPGEKTIHHRPPPNAELVHDLLTSLNRSGFHCVPEYRGLDYLGDEILSFLPGEVPSDQRIWSTKQIVASIALIRAYHDATAVLPLRGDQEVVCHGQMSPLNTVFQNGIPYGLIHFDKAHAGSRLSDLGYAAWTWLNLGSKGIRRTDVSAGIELFAYVYGGISSMALTAEIARIQEAPPIPSI